MQSHRHTHAGALVVDIGHLAANVDGVEVIARMQLAARRAGCRVEFSGASPELRALLIFCGLSGVVELRGEAEQRKELLDAQERVQPGDPPA